MNLSNYLQMPPAPAVPQTTPSGPAKGAAAVVGLDTGGNLKLDFAQLMARQFEQMPQLKRQDLAASGHLPKLDTLSKDREERDTRVDSTSRANLNDRAGVRSSENAADPNKNSADEQADAQLRRDKRNRTQADDAATAATMAPALHTTAIQKPSEDQTPDEALANLPDGSALQTVRLSEQTKLITDPRHAPNAQSLMAFAQSMGMDPQAIGQLMGDADLGNLAANAALGQASANAQTPAQLAANLGQTLSPHQGSSQLQASLTAAMQANGMGHQSGEAAAMLTSMSATQIQAHSVGTPSQAVNLPASTMTTMQMLAPTDPNAAMQNMMQMGMLPVAPATATQTGSGFDILSLHSAELPESQITALAGLLAESGQADGSSLSQDQQSPGDGQSGAFAQTLAAKANAADAANRNSAQGVNRPMSEVYEQLSDKLSTEMAARMHEQINAGQWKMKFGLRPAHLGGVEVQLEMKDGKLNAQLNAENPMTRELLQNSSQRLREALANLGVQTHQVTVGQNQTGFAHNGSSQGQGSGNPSQVGENLGSSVSTSHTAQEAGNVHTSDKRSDSLLDLYA